MSDDTARRLIVTACQFILRNAKFGKRAEFDVDGLKVSIDVELDPSDERAELVLRLTMQ